MVVVFFSGRAMRFRMLKLENDLPDPVGPVIRKMPLGFSIRSVKRWKLCSERPSCSTSGMLLTFYRRRITAFSP